MKHNDIERNYRSREDEILFMDLREMGSPFEKKFIQFLPEDRGKVTRTYHDWQQTNNIYIDIPEFCYSATLDEVRGKDYSLVPSKYVAFINRDENVDFESKMNALQKDFSTLLKSEEQSKKDLLNVFKELGYEIEL